MNNFNQKITQISLIKLSIPTIFMLIFMSLYSIVDGVFVSRFVGTNALSAVNIIYPFINVLIAVGVMLASGGSAIIAKKLGEKKDTEAKQDFSLIILIGLLIGISFTVLSLIFSDKIIYLLGSNNDLYDYCKDYFFIIALFSPAFILSLLYQILSITSGNPRVGLYLTLVGGISNMILDYIFIVPMDMGIAGASLATSIGNLVPTILGTFYFSKKHLLLHFVKPKFNFKTIKDSCINGSSEMVGNLSTGITTILFNITMMKLLGSDGVSALTIVLYGQFLITAVFLGFSTGVAPIISYHYGANNQSVIRDIVKYSSKCIIISSIIMYILSVIGSKLIVGIFAPIGSNVYNIGYKGFLIFSLSFLITGINIFASAMFTAFSNGKISAILSFFRTFIFIIAGIVFLPKIFGVNGVWLSVPVAEALSAIMSLVYLNKYKNIYGYGKDNRNDYTIKKEAI